MGQDEVAAGTHELNNLLGVILNYAQFALEQADGRPTLRADLEEIEAAARRASELTNALAGAAQAAPEPAAELELSTPPGDSGHGERILLVQDEEAVRRLTQRILAEHGYEVIPADRVDAALALWHERAHEIDLVLTDPVMPGMSGTALVERLREQRPGVAVLFLSRHAGGLGGSEPRPFSSAALLDSVRGALAARE